MAKEKFTLTELKVQSFVTTLENEELNRVKGGYYAIRGRRYTYQTRWTTVETRTAELVEALRPTGKVGFDTV